MMSRLSTACLTAVFIILTYPVAAQTIATDAREAIVLDYTTGRILLDKNADERMPTASMSKLATMYMVFEAIQNGRLQLDDELPVSETAWRKGGSKMFVDVGTRVAVSDLMRGVIVQSGNDATIVLAEALNGTEDAFADAMTRRMREIGLNNTQFMNASGWPDPDHYSTARDLSTLAILMIRGFPQFYRIYSELEFTYNGIKQGNRNPLLYRNVGADGLKTGHTEEAGFGLVASAERNNRRIVMVLNGLSSAQARADESAKLLEWAFANFDNYRIYQPGSVVHDLPVWLGAEARVPLVLDEEVVVTLSMAEKNQFSAHIEVEQPVAAPVAVGDILGQLVVTIADQTRRYPLRAAQDVAQLDFASRVEAALTHIVFGSQ
jgi:serine-type D-Ala-D-Ala carboxypeptidase (penicillin-binding protein 5/6)